jgi:hypothetical protein
MEELQVLLVEIEMIEIEEMIGKMVEETKEEIQEIDFMMIIEILEIEQVPLGQIGIEIDFDEFSKNNFCNFAFS